MAAKLSPIGNAQFMLSDGTPAVGNKLFFYVAGSVNTKQNSYTDSSGTVANSNPIVLNALGMATDGVWLTDGLAYKIVYAPSTDTDPPTSPIETWDDVVGVVGTSNSADQWVAFGGAPTYISATQFTLAGDQTSTFTVGRRVKTTNSGGTVYSRISASAYGALTTITVVNDSGTLDAGLSAVSYGLISPDNTSAPVFRDNTFRVADNSDPTKLVALELSGITTATTRTLTVLDADFTIGAATQAQQETGSITTAAVTPGRQQFHPSAAKGWCKADASGGAAAAYNVSSVTDTGVGDAAVNWGTDFTSDAYCAVASCNYDPNGTAAGTLTAAIKNTGFAAGVTAIVVQRVSDGASTDPNHFQVVAFGDQP